MLTTALFSALLFLSICHVSLEQEEACNAPFGIMSCFAQTKQFTPELVGQHYTPLNMDQITQFVQKVKALIPCFSNMVKFCNTDAKYSPHLVQALNYSKAFVDDVSASEQGKEMLLNVSQCYEKLQKNAKAQVDSCIKNPLDGTLNLSAEQFHKKSCCFAKARQECAMPLVRTHCSEQEIVQANTAMEKLVTHFNCTALDMQC